MIPSINVTFDDVEGAPPQIALCDESKYGLGIFEYIGYIKTDLTAVYARQTKDKKGGRSVILFDAQGKNKWIATVISFSFITQ